MEHLQVNIVVCYVHFTVPIIEGVAWHNCKERSGDSCGESTEGEGGPGMAAERGK